MSYNIIPLTILIFTFVTSATCLATGFLVYSRDKKNPTTIFHLVMAVTAVSWAIAIVFFRFTTLMSVALYHFATISVILLVQAFFLFAYTFAVKKDLSVKATLFLVAPSVLLVAAVLSDQVPLMHSFSYQEVINDVLLHSPYAPFEYLFLLLWCLASIVLLYKKFMTSAGVFKQKYRLIALLYTVPVVLGMVLSLVLPLIGDMRFVYIGPIITTIVITLTAFLLVSYYRWNFRIFLTQLFLIFISLMLMTNVLLANQIEDFIAKGLFLILYLIAAYFLSQNVKRETQSIRRVNRLKKELARRNQELNFSNHRNSAFITTTSNQLRDPLAGIRWHCESILSGAFGDVPEGSVEYVRRIHQSSKRLLVIVDDFLNLRKIEQEEMTYAFSDFDMKKVVRSVYDEMVPVAKDENLSLSCDDDGTEYFLMNGDEGKLRQVISNLVDNAIKYTKEGQVEIFSQSFQDQVTVSVKDSGIGLSEEETQKLFQKFSRMEGARRVNTSGSGLGLYIAYEMVRAHGGTIRATSEGHGTGTTFTVEVPKTPQKPKEEERRDKGEKLPEKISEKQDPLLKYAYEPE